MYVEIVCADGMKKTQQQHQNTMTASVLLLEGQQSEVVVMVTRRSQTKQAGDDALAQIFKCRQQQHERKERWVVFANDVAGPACMER